jgi:hypothetical protein
LLVGDHLGKETEDFAGRAPVDILTARFGPKKSLRSGPVIARIIGRLTPNQIPETSR